MAFHLFPRIFICDTVNMVVRKVGISCHCATIAVLRYFEKLFYFFIHVLFVFLPMNDSDRELLLFRSLEYGTCPDHGLNMARKL